MDGGMTVCFCDSLLEYKCKYIALPCTSSVCWAKFNFSVLQSPLLQNGGDMGFFSGLYILMHVKCLKDYQAQSQCCVCVNHIPWFQ
jgi:hypothetical protein